MAQPEVDVVLSDVLTTGEISDLGIEVRRKFSNYILECKKKILDVETSLERNKINSEQRYFELEKDTVHHKSQLASQAESLADATKKLAETERNYNEAASRLSSLQSQLASLQADKGHLEFANLQLKGEKEELSTLLDRKAKDIQTLNGEWKTMSAKLAQITNEKCEAVAKLDDLESKEISLQYRETRFEQDKAHLQQQIDWLNGELSQKSEELFNLKRSQATTMMELHNQVELKTTEANHLQEMLESQRKTNEQQLAHINSYIQKLKDVQSSTMQVEEQYRCELQAQQRLVQLYKASAEESEEKVKELMTAVEELQKLLRQVTEEYRVNLQAKENDILRLEEGLKMRDEQIQKMDLELKNCNELLKRTTGQMRQEDIEAMSPSAAAASRLLRSGMTLTQIYSEYVQSTDALALEKEENKRLNLYLDQILQEIEEKAPVLTRQRDELENALERISNLTMQLEQAMLESERERISSDEANKKASSLLREEARLRRENKDLSLQVQILLKELEQSCGNYVSSTEPESDGYNATEEVSSSAHIITDKLVTFRNVEELQTQNQKLLQVVRELSEDREAAERASVDARTSELQKQLAAAEQDIEEMRAARARQIELVESIVRQRDMYRVMLGQTGMSLMPPVQASSPQKSHSSVQTAMSPAAVVDVPHKEASSDPSLSSVTELKSAMKELQEEFVTYKRERQQNEKILSDQAEVLKKEQSDLRLQSAKLMSQLEFSNERFKALQANADGYKRELEMLRARNMKHSASIVQHEQTIANLRQETMAVQERLARSDARCQALSQERDMLKTAESRLLLEMESMRREKSTSNLLMTNLMAIQNNLERTEFELKTKYGNRTESVERENVSLKKRLDAAEEHLRAITKSLEDQLASTRDRLEKEISAHQKTREELMRSYTDISNLKQELSTVVSTKAAGTPLSTTSTHQPAHVLAQDKPAMALSTPLDDDMQLELQEAKSQIGALTAQLDKSRLHVEQYKAIAEGIEQSLREQNEASRQFKQSVEKKLEEAASVNADGQKAIQALEKERQDLLNENIRISEESHQLNADLRKQLTSLQNELESCAQRLENATVGEQLARKELLAQSRLAQEAQDKYERELLLHASNVERLNVLKGELENFNSRMVAAQDAAIAAEVTLHSSLASWQEREKQLAEENARLSSKLTDVDKQRELLHDQLENLSAQMAALGRRDSASLDTSFGEESTKTKSSEQLMEVIRFLRREKEIAETKLEMSQAEGSRFKQRLQLLGQQMEETSRALSAEREKNEVISQTAVQHAELLRKVEQLNLLSDSNRLLREDKERLAVQVQESELKVQKLGSEIEPLRQELGQLEARAAALENDKKLLQSEVERWKARTNQLIEQSHKADPEELKRAVNERDELKKKVSGYVEDNQKSRAEISRLNNQLALNKNECNQAKQQAEKVISERDELKKKVSTYIEENQKHRAEISRLNNQLSTLKNELSSSKQQLDRLTTQLNTARTENISATAASAAAASVPQLSNAAPQQAGSISAGAASAARDAPSSLEGIASVSGTAAAGLPQGATKQPSADDKGGEVQQLQKKIQDLMRQLDEKEKIVTNLRKIGRKYKQQYEDLLKEQLTQKAIAVGSTPAAGDTSSGQAATAAASAPAAPPSSESTEGAAVVKELTAKIEQLEEERSMHQRRCAELEAKVNAFTSQLARLTEENSKLREAEENLKAEHASSDSKLREMLRTAKTKLQSQREEIVQLQQHNRETEEKLQQQHQQHATQMQQLHHDHETSQAELRGQHETDMRRLENELQDAKRAVQEFVEDMQQQQVMPHPASMPATSTVSTTAAADHPTANIRPLTSPAAGAHTSHALTVPTAGAQLRHAAPVVQHVVGAIPSAAAASAASSSSAAAATAASSAMGSGRMTASIRPMSQSRTATVMPTTVTAAVATPSTMAIAGTSSGQQVEAASSSSITQPVPAPSALADGVEPLAVSVTQQSAVRRLQPVQPVSPRLDEGVTPTSSSVPVGLVSPPMTAAVMATSSQSQQPEPDTSSRQAAAAADDRSSSSLIAEASAAGTPAGSKRTRTDEESPESSTREPEVKKAKAETVVMVTAEGAATSAAVSEIQTEEEEEETVLGQEAESLGADMAAAADNGGDEPAAAHEPGEVQPAAGGEEINRDADEMEAVEENEAAAMPASEEASSLSMLTSFGQRADSIMPAPSEEPSSELQEVFIEGSDDGNTQGQGMPSADDVVVVEEDIESVQYEYGEPEDEEGNYEESEQAGAGAHDEDDTGSNFEGDAGQESDQDRYDDDSGREYDGEGEEDDAVHTAEQSGEDSRASSGDGQVEGTVDHNPERDNEDDTNDDDDVVIVDDDTPSAPAVSSGQPAASSMTPHLVPSMSQQAPQNRRRQLTTAVTRLHSFHGANTFVTQTSMFGETNEDGVVPSTPTLFVPKRTDGFAEAVSSPYRVTDSFLFASGADQQPEFGQLASQVYMDDIRDMSQFGNSEGSRASAGVGSSGAMQSQAPAHSTQMRAAAAGSQHAPRAATTNSTAGTAAVALQGDEQLAQPSRIEEPGASGSERDDGDPAGSSGLSAEAAELVRGGTEIWDDAAANFPSSSLPGATASSRLQRSGARGTGSQPNANRGTARSSRLNRPQFRSDQQ